MQKPMVAYQSGASAADGEVDRAVPGVRGMLARSRAAVNANVFVWLGLLAWATASVAWVFRIRTGVSNGDEAFYGAMSYGFILGNRPYVDELALHQNAAILMMPLFRAYLWVRGSSDGILLFNRVLYVAYLMSCAGLTYRFVAKVATREAAGWAAALVCTVVYFNLPALSYNTLGALGYFAGILLSALSMFDERPARRLFVASLFLATAVFSYPTLVFGALPHALLCVRHVRRRAGRETWRNALLGLGAGVLLALCFAAAFVVWVTPAGIERALEFSRAMSYGKQNLLEKLGHLDPIDSKQAWFVAAYALLLALFPIALAHLRRAAWLLVGLLPALLATIALASGESFSVSRGSLFLMATPALAPACLAWKPEFRERRLLLELVWLPGVTSMLVVVGTSAMGITAAHLGALPVLTAGVASLGALGSERAAEPATRLRNQVVSVAFLASALVLQLQSLFEVVYDRTLQRGAVHDTAVTSGPFQGALAQAADAAQLEAVQRDLQSLPGDGKTLAIFDDFPTGYLSTGMRPRTFSHWVVWSSKRRYDPWMKATYGQPDTQPDFVLLINAGKGRTFWRRYQKDYRVVIRRPEYGYEIQQRTPRS